MNESEPTPEEILQHEERGFIQALDLVTEQAPQRWPRFEDTFELHRLIFAEANPSMAGKYRPDTFWPAYIRFPVPHWRAVPGCMLRLEALSQAALEECAGLEGELLNDRVLEWIARLHHRFERIHPFQDGNGRVGRLLATWMLLHFDFPPFVFTKELKPAYLDALAAADAAVSVDDLSYIDFYPRQTEALQPLMDFLIQSVYELSRLDAEG